jgi:hypothetical protein
MSTLSRYGELTLTAPTGQMGMHDVRLRPDNQTVLPSRPKRGIAQRSRRALADQGYSESLKFTRRRAPPK